MKSILLIVMAFLSGFAGATLQGRLMRESEQVVRARTFELVDQAGRTISYWGVDKGENVVLAFGQAGTFPGHPGLGLGNPHDQRTAVGLFEDSPFLKFRGPDGKDRITMRLSVYQKPYLAMEDQRGDTTRILLGVEPSDTPGPDDNNWVLAFRPEKAEIGMITEKHGGLTFVRGIFMVNKEPLKYP